jgi:hypothetical protein
VRGCGVVKYGVVYTVKKVSDFPFPRWDVKLFWPGIIKVFLARESFVNDFTAGNWKISNLFLQCIARFLAQLLMGW